MSARSSAPFRVLEIAGPSVAPCGRLLAEAGADVIKVEPPQAGVNPQLFTARCADTARIDSSTLFQDTGKRGITLDLDHPTGRDLFLRLARSVDVVVEGLAPGGLARCGLAYDILAAANPGLVLVSITPFGQDGPYHDFVANDLVVFALGGLMFISGLPGDPPVVAPNQQAYALAATHAALATLAALWGRRVDGRGDWVDVSIFECLAAQENTVTNYQGPGQFTRRNGSQHRTALPGSIVACLDGYIHLYIGRERDVWGRFVAWLGQPEELADERLAEINTRWQHADVVMQVTRRVIGQRTMAEVYQSAQELHLPFVPVYTPAQFLDDEQTVARQLVMEVPHPRRGSYRTLRPPLALGTSATPCRHAPTPGEHNTEVYTELAALTMADLARLQEDGVV